MPTSFAFSEPKVRAIQPPRNGAYREYHKDTKFPGLQVCVTSTGKRTYYYVRRVGGKPKRMMLGTIEQLTVEQARKAAAKKAGKVADGEDPQDDRRRKMQEQSLKELWGDWLEVHAKPRKRTWEDDKRQWEKYIADTFGGRRPSNIKTSEIAKWHVKIGNDHGHVQANRAKALLATLLNHAVRIGLLAANPCRSVPNFPEQSRERFLLPAEMRKFFDSLVAVGDPWHDFFQLALFTGARRGNVASMAWNEIDLDRTTWTIPASKTKNKKPTVISLSPPAEAILRSRKELVGVGEYVFPSNSATGHVVDPRKAWERLRKESGLTDLRMHDLRRSLGSWQAAAGASLAIIGASLGHTNLKSTQVYARLQLDPVRASVNEAVSAMLVAGGQSKMLGLSEPDEQKAQVVK